jgi:hypothetical protein
MSSQYNTHDPLTHPQDSRRVTSATSAAVAVATDSALTIPCPRCAFSGPHQIGPGTGPHAASLLCGQCSRWLRWRSTRTPQEREARRREALAKLPPSPGQLRFLAAGGYRGPQPTSMLEASNAIDGLLDRRVTL